MIYTRCHCYRKQQLVLLALKHAVAAVCCCCCWQLVYLRLLREQGRALFKMYDTTELLLCPSAADVFAELHSIM